MDERDIPLVREKTRERTNLGFARLLFLDERRRRSMIDRRAKAWGYRGNDDRLVNFMERETEWELVDEQESTASSATRKKPSDQMVQADQVWSGHGT